MLRVGVRRNDMDNYQHEMGRPPQSPKHTKIQTPHKTSKQQNDPKKINLHDNSKILTETRRGRKKLQQIKRIYEVQCSNMLYMSTEKKIDVTNTYSPNTTSLQQLKSHLNQNNRLTKKN
ncbi:hypothetical protein TNCV_2812911 [Trichonephila clavipes]|nr:hypothetical protein TNCV_2812911 [Trichonephila clavipes]